MALAHPQIAAMLNELNCRSNFNIHNVTEYMLPQTKEPIYLHLQGKQACIVIRPAFEVFASELTGIAGVNGQYEYHHNAQMTRFPTRQHKGISETHYGLAFTFDTPEALRDFMTRLLAIVTG
ncbi:hypothetical protein [Shewanella sp. SNU WT4]|uniref:hypothetical protein n=1 Tax=Shewanella sp. SNU WT4 TaxID=2590015 RepID=UPI00143D32F9|nr:hypothetical protein [Shewanella sp. SNU WT4]